MIRRSTSLTLNVKLQTCKKEELEIEMFRVTNFFIFSVIDSILTNEFVSKSLKKSIQVAGKKGFGSPGTCHVFKCHHHLLPQQYG